MAGKIIEAERLTYTIAGAEAVSHLTFSVNAGDYVGIVGPNGSGKTTLMKLLLGLIKPGSGNVSIFGTDPLVFKEWRKIGYIPQKLISGTAGFPATVKEIVEMGLLAGKKTPKRITVDDGKKVQEVLQTLNIFDLRKKLIGNLSGGQQQRVFLARALVNAPELIILDEPTAAVDASTSEKFMLLVSELCREKHVTVMHVTHDIANIGKYANKLLYIDKKLVFYGTFGDFCLSPEAAIYFGKYAQHIICHKHDQDSGQIKGQGNND